MNRRRFITQALAGTALTAAAWPGRSFSAPAASAGRGRIPLGFFGASHSHGVEKVKVILASRDFELVGVHEDDPAIRATCARLGAPLLLRDQLLERSRVVAVESAVRDHARHATLALQAGKHVHVEKPPADNIADMRSLVALAREKKLLLQSGYMWRYNPAFQRLFEAAKAGWLGDIFLVRAFISNLLPPARRPEWGQFKGGTMFELGSHLLDAIVRLLGRPQRVTPFLRRDGAAQDNFRDNNVAVLEYERCLAVIYSTSLHPAKLPPRSFEVLGANGTVAIGPIEPPTLEIELVKAAGPYQAGRQQVPLPPYQRYRDDFVELAAAVRGERPLSVSLEEELLVQETVLSASEM